MHTRLRDLDELIISCRSKSSKEYIQEAIACYEAGAFRASIISTWTSVFFDIVEKCQELALSGDAAAISLVERFEKAETNRDLSALLKFEREILQSAGRDIELFSEIEHSDLRRIQEDRHRCAHPTRNLKGERFVPSAELARAHIVTAVDILLSQPASQGKAALEGILGTIDSKFFPNQIEKAKEALLQTGLAKPRYSLIRNLLIVLMKACLHTEKELALLAKTTAVKAVLSLHRSATLEVFKNDLEKIVRATPDSNVTNLVWFASRINEVVSFFPTHQLERMRSHVRQASSEDIFDVELAFGIAELSTSAALRTARMSLEEIANIYFFDEIRPEYKSRLTELLALSKSYDEANAVSDKIEKHLADFTEDEKNRILAIEDENDQVKYAFNYGALKNAIKAKSERSQ